MKRLFDIVVAAIGLLIFSPVLLPVMFLVWKQDGCSPFYLAVRVGMGGQPFKMIKLRSMVINAEMSGVDSTSSNDSRITPIGHFIRRYKFDELTQLWNVLLGHMSLVGPRPNVQREVDSYTEVEKGLLSVRPGITDFSSIVFSDEGEILEGKECPDLAYNQLIRPWKSRLGLIYIDNHSFWLDIQLVIYTAVAIFSRKKAISWVVNKLRSLGVDERVIIVSQREDELVPFPPPGARKIVEVRNI